jgi:hypothetical protein
LHCRDELDDGRPRHGAALVSDDVDGSAADVEERVRPFKGQPLRLLQPATPFDFHFAAGNGAAWIGYGDDVVARVEADTGAVRQIAAGSADGVAADAGAVWTIGGKEDGQADGTIFRIDDRTGSVDEVASGVGPMYGIAVGANGVWTIDGNSERTWEIDPDLLRVAAMIPLDHPPEFAAVGAGAVWLANADGTVSRVDGKTAAVVKTIPLGRYPRLAYPAGLAIGDGVVWVAVH